MESKPTGKAGLASSIYGRIREQIARGEMQPGDRLSSLRHYATSHGCAVQTVVEAYEMLVSDGAVEPRRGSGYYVTGPRPAPVSLETFTPAVELALQGLGMDDIHGLDLHNSPAVGLPPSKWLEACRLDRFLPKVARGGLGIAFRPGDPRGYPPLRARLAQRLETLGIAVSSDHIVLTQGAHHAMDLALRTFVQPGEPVLVDDPGFFQIYRKLALHGAVCVPVPRTIDGIDPVQVEDRVRRTGARLFFTQSLSHNPTGTDISEQAGRRLRDICERTGLLVVDDDALSDYRSASCYRFAAADGLEHSLYIGTFTKSISNMLRVGYVAATPERASRLIESKITTVLNSSQLAERTVETIITGKQFDRHLAHLRRVLERATASSAAALNQIGAELFFTPHSSLYLWARFPDIPDSFEFARYAAAQGVALAPGALFRPKSSEPTPWLRFNSGTLGDPERIAGLCHGFTRDRMGR